MTGKTQPLKLPSQMAERYCHELMKKLEKERRIDFESKPLCEGIPDPRLATDILFSESRGQMFGILVCTPAAEHKHLILKAFSGQYNGVWEVPGWAPPLIDPDRFRRAVKLADPPIKHLTAQIDSLPPSEPRRAELIQQRRDLSQKHMLEIHKMYVIRNFAGGTSDLFSIFEGRAGIPAGTGDCCAPKLLNRAAVLGLRPLSLAEFYWGRETRSGTKQHGRFYPPCVGKCGPLLDFMLGAGNC